MSTEFSLATLFDCVELADEPRSMVIKREQMQSDWLEAYAAHGWTAASEATGVADATIMRWMRRDEAFRAAHAAAALSTATRLERVVDAIATGEADATAQQVSMLQFRLRALRPEVYRERASLQIDQRTTLAIGEGGRARLLLAEWHA